MKRKAIVIDMSEAKTDAVGKTICVTLRGSNEEWITYSELIKKAREYLNHYFPAVSCAMNENIFNRTAEMVLRTLEEHWYVGRRDNSYMFLGE